MSKTACKFRRTTEMFITFIKRCYAIKNISKYKVYSLLSRREVDDDQRIKSICVVHGSDYR